MVHLPFHLANEPEINGHDRTSRDEDSIRNAVIALYKNLMQQQEKLFGEAM